MQLGIIRNKNEEYHGGHGISVSGLKALAKSGLHYWSEYLDPSREKAEQSGVLMLGTAIHCEVLEPDAFPYRYVVVPDGIDRRSKIGREFFDEILAEGKTPLRPEDYDLIKRTAASIASHPKVREILAMPHLIETSLYWRESVVIDNETGEVVDVVCKCRPDLMVEPCAAYPNGLIFDLKTAEDADVEDFSRAAFRYQYHMQAAWYADGFQRLYGTAEPPEFWFGAVEKSPPFARRVYSATEFVQDDDGGISPGVLMLGRQEYQRLLTFFAKCKATNVWPGYEQEVKPLPLPGYAQKLIETNDDIEVEYV